MKERQTDDGLSIIRILTAMPPGKPTDNPSFKATIPHLIRLWLCAKINNGFSFAVAAAVLDNGDVRSFADGGGGWTSSSSRNRKMFCGHFGKIAKPKNRTEMNALHIERIAPIPRHMERASERETRVFITTFDDKPQARD